MKTKKSGAGRRHLLVIDAGNTNVVFGVYPEGKRKILGVVRLASSRDRTSDEYAVFLRDRLARLGFEPSSICQVVVGSVVPPLDPVLESLSIELFGVPALFIDHESIADLPIRIDHPAEVGADRILNALAARERYGAPAIVVDFGTATTFDVVSPAGEYAGGVIVPGAGISAEALFLRAARLPRVEIRRPARVVGRSTVQSMQSGLYFGYLSLIEGILERIRVELGQPRIPVIATGGLASVFQHEKSLFTVVDPDLTLDGLVLAHERIRARASDRTGKRRRRA